MAEENNAGTGEQNQESGGAGGGAGAGDQGADSLDAVMGAYVATAKQLPGVIPELIAGKTLTEINSSIDAAKAAFNRVKEQVTPGDTGKKSDGASSAGAVGTGAGTGGAGQETPKLSPFEKIMAGLEQQRQSR